MKLLSLAFDDIEPVKVKTSPALLADTILECKNINPNIGFDYQDEINTVKESLENIIKKLSKEGFLLQIEQLKRGSQVFLEFSITEGELSFKNYEKIKELLHKKLSDILAELIIEKKEISLIRNIIKRTYKYFSPEEHYMLEASIDENLNNGLPEKNDFNFKNRKKMIEEELLTYLDQNHELILEGFIAFRLKQYKNRLAEVIDLTVNNFMIEQEYNEFINVLKYFVDIQIPKTSEAHIVFESFDSFKILDSNGKLINTQYLDDIGPHMFEGEDIYFEPSCSELSCDDALISVLITIAPNKIVIHSNSFMENKNVIDTIKSIFPGRTLICTDCELCCKNILEEQQK
ncbi:putative sporulation protein YtxC [Selenomonadales bacterium OttesenSCG-928-I06]|nr:putative sporulation protein YtxC [Selenomonadales bacterium OttesenSCG-928-I06]